MEKILECKLNDYSFNLHKSFIGINLITAYHSIIKFPYYNPLLDDPKWNQLTFVFYILKGSMKILWNKKEYLLPENTVFFGQTGSDIVLTDNGEESEFICFHFQLFNYSLPLYKANFVPAKKELSTVNKILKYLRMQSDLGIGSANAAFMDLLFGWLRKIRSSNTEKNPHYNSILEAELYINEHIYEKLSITDLAARYNFSEKHFRYLFNKIIGMPPKKYIERVKCERAFDLLRNTSYSVAEIAEKLNYSSPQHLAINLKKIFNLKPSDCRKVQKFLRNEL